VNLHPPRALLWAAFLHSLAAEMAKTYLVRGGHPFAMFMSTLSYGIRDPLLSNHRDSLLYSIPGISLLVLCI